MKIVITGCHGALAQKICNVLSDDGHIVLCLDERIDDNVQNVVDLVSDCDVFINCGYKEQTQSTLFDKIYNHWRYEEKTIINILTSAIIFGGSNEEYIKNKKHLEDLTIRLRDEDKNVRVTNIYPNTLESRKNNGYNTLPLEQVANVIKWVLEQPQDIEIFQLGISRTKTRNDSTLI